LILEYYNKKIKNTHITSNDLISNQKEEIMDQALYQQAPAKVKRKKLLYSQQNQRTRSTYIIKAKRKKEHVKRGTHTYYH
jgi:hypothetical protein